MRFSAERGLVALLGSHPLGNCNRRSSPGIGPALTKAMNALQQDKQLIWAAEAVQTPLRRLCAQGLEQSPDITSNIVAWQSRLRSMVSSRVVRSTAAAVRAAP